MSSLLPSDVLTPRQLAFIAERLPECPEPCCLMVERHRSPTLGTPPVTRPETPANLPGSSR